MLIILCALKIKYEKSFELFSGLKKVDKCFNLIYSKVLNVVDILIIEDDLLSLKSIIYRESQGPSINYVKLIFFNFLHPSPTFFLFIIAKL